MWNSTNSRHVHSGSESRRSFEPVVLSAGSWPLTYLCNWEKGSRLYIIHNTMHTVPMSGLKLKLHISQLCYRYYIMLYTFIHTCIKYIDIVELLSYTLLFCTRVHCIFPQLRTENREVGSILSVPLYSVFGRACL